jgi:hypothetical protein
MDNWQSSMPHEYHVREVADLSGLDNAEFAELKRLNEKVVSLTVACPPSQVLTVT